MGLSIIKGDILNLPKEFDAIAIPGRYNLKLIGNIGGKVKDICGPKLEMELGQYKELSLTKAVISNAYNLNCKKIIHIANPKYNKKNSKVADQLKKSYLNALTLAYNFDLKSVAFASLSTGVYMYPIKEATEIALNTMSEFLKTHDMDLALVIYTKKSFEECKEIYEKYNTEIIEGELTDKDSRINERFKLMDDTDAWYAKKYEDKKVNPVAESIAEIINDIIDTNKLKLNGKQDEYYANVCSRQTYNHILKGRKEASRDVLIGIGINMCFNTFQINRVLKIKNARLSKESNRDRIIIEAADKNYENCIIKKGGVMSRTDAGELNDILIKASLFPLESKTHKNKNDDD